MGENGRGSKFFGRLASWDDGLRMAPAKTPILLGTGNPAKSDALRRLLEGLPVDPVTTSRLGLAADPEEAGDTHLAIAALKAQEWSQAGSMLAIASDGGLLIPALGPGWDSRYTHRFAGPEADDAQRRDRLLGLMRPFRGQDRRATWVEALAVAHRGRLLAAWELQGATGLVTDRASAPPPSPGFWAFSVWRFPEYDKTYDQLSPQQLEALNDHWIRLRGLAQSFLRRYLDSGQQAI